MPSGSTNSRNKMKKERPEKYQQYLDSQKKRSAEYRRKMKEALTNPTEKDKERRKKHLERQRARMQRYLERKKRQKAAAQSAPNDSNGESDEMEPVSSTSGNVSDMQHDSNITSSQRPDTQQQDGESRHSDIQISYQDREISSQQDDMDSPDEGLHIFEEDMEDIQDIQDSDDAEITQDIFRQGRIPAAPMEDQNIQSRASSLMGSSDIQQSNDTRRQILDIPDYDTEIRQQLNNIRVNHRNEEISRPDDGPNINNSIHLQRESPSNVPSPLMSYLTSLNNLPAVPRRCSNMLSDSYDTQNHTIGLENVSTGNDNSDVRNFSEQGNISTLHPFPRTLGSSSDRPSLLYSMMTSGHMEEREFPFVRSDISSTTPRNPIIRPTPVNGNETLEYINMDTGKHIRSVSSPSRTGILKPLEPPLNLSIQRNPVPFSDNETIPLYPAPVCSSTSNQRVSTTTVRREQSVLVDTQLVNELNSLRQVGGSPDGELPNILQEDIERNFTTVIPGPGHTEVNVMSSVDVGLSSQTGTSNNQVTAHDRFLDSIAGPSLPAPTPYTRYKSQQITSAAAATPGRIPEYYKCAQHPGEIARMSCMDCNRVMLCLECSPCHYRHRLTRYREVNPVKVIQQKLVDMGCPQCMMMIGSVFYFDTDYSITTYNMNTDTTEQIDTDGGDILDMCLSPDNTSIWYCTWEREVYEYDVENRTCQLRFTFDSGDTLGICVTRSGDVVLGVWRCSDDSDSDDSDSDDSDSGCDVKYKCYLEMYTQQDSYTTCTTSVCIKGERGLKYGVKPHYIMACPVTGDLLVTEFHGNTVLLTDDKCNTKFWFRGKTVTNKHGDRKRTGYNSRLRTRDAACFDKEGNILILNGDDDSVIVIDHDTGMYIRTVHQEPGIDFMCIQDNGLLWCCVDDCFKHKLTSIKYIEKLQ